MADPGSNAQQNHILPAQEPSDAPTNGPLEDSDLPFEEERGRTRRLTELVLQKLGLSWETNVQEVYPIAGTSTWGLMKEVAFHHKWTMLTSSSDCNQVRRAVELSLGRWPVFRSIMVEYSEDLRLLVALRTDRAYFDRSISSEPAVESVRALSAVPIQKPTHVSGQLADGLCFHVVIAKVKSMKTVGLLVCADHALYDWVSVHSWAKELNQIINGEILGDLTPYKMFTNAYHLYQDSQPARRAQEYHRQHFQRDSISSNALWPPGDDLLSWYTAAAGGAASTSFKRSLDDPGFETVNSMANVAGMVERIRYCPNMATAYSTRGISASMAVNMAVCLFNYRKTGHVHAILTMFLAGRTWPFMSPDLAAYLPNPTTIAGPTVVTMVNVTRIDPEEQVGQLFARMKEEQQDFNRHPHVPQYMLPQLNQESRGMRMQAMRQIFNWLPRRTPDDGTSSEEEYGLNHENSAPLGVVWICKLLGHDSLNVRLTYNSGLFSEKQATEFVDQVFEIVEWICDPGNWDSRIDLFVEAFKDV